jgi:hypothetical protein
LTPAELQLVFMCRDPQTELSRLVTGPAFCDPAKHSGISKLESNSSKTYDRFTGAGWTCTHGGARGLQP